MNEDAGQVPRGDVTGEGVVRALDYEEFTRQRRPELLRYVRRLADDRQQGEDALQEALIEAYRQWPEVSVMEQPLGWVLRVTSHKLYLLRRGLRRSPSASSPASPEAVADPSEAFVENSALWDAVSQLSPRLRQVISIRLTFDFDSDEIATLLDLRESTVRGHLARAYARLKVLLTSVQRDDAP